MISDETWCSGFNYSLEELITILTSLQGFLFFWARCFPCCAFPGDGTSVHINVFSGSMKSAVTLVSPSAVLLDRRIEKSHTQLCLLPFVTLLITHNDISCVIRTHFAHHSALPVLLPNKAEVLPCIRHAASFRTPFFSVPTSTCHLWPIATPTVWFIRYFRALPSGQPWPDTAAPPN